MAGAAPNDGIVMNKYGELISDVLLNVAEILVLRLPEGSERFIAAKWVKKFHACDPSKYANNLQLFINSLTKQVLVEPFNVAPTGPREEWVDFPKQYTSRDINAAVKRRIFKDSYAPPYRMEFSQNLDAMACFQEIPYFGSHFYYAFSTTERINEWQNFNKLNIPRKFAAALKIAEPEESPIKRVFRKSKIAKPKQIQLKAACPPQQKEGWQNVIEEEPEPEAAAVSTIVAIPVAGIKNKRLEQIVKASDKRVEQVKRNRTEADAKKTPAVGVKAGSKAAPVKPGDPNKKAIDKLSTSRDKLTPAGSSTSLHKSIVDKKGAAACAQAAVSLTRVEPEAEALPVATALTLHETLNKIKMNISMQKEIAETTENIYNASENLVNALDRTGREKTPNPCAVMAIQNQEIEIGEELLDIANEMDDGEDDGQGPFLVEDEFKGLYLDLAFLDKKTPLGRPDLLNRLNNIRNSIGGLTAQNILQRPEEAPELIAERVLDVSAEAIESANRANIELGQLQPRSPSDQNFIENLVLNNNLVATEGQARVSYLIRKIEQKAPNVLVDANNAARAMINFIGYSIENNEEEVEKYAAAAADVSPVVFEASGVQDAANLILENVAGQFQELERISLTSPKKADYAQVIAPEARRRLAVQEPEEDIIDINDIDIDFGEAGASEVMNRWERGEHFDAMANSRFDSVFGVVAGEGESEAEADEGHFTRMYQAMYNDGVEVLVEISEELERIAGNSQNQAEIDAVQEVQARINQSIQVVQEAQDALHSDLIGLDHNDFSLRQQ